MKTSLVTFALAELKADPYQSTLPKFSSIRKAKKYLRRQGLSKLPRFAYKLFRYDEDGYEVVHCITSKRLAKRWHLEAWSHHVRFVDLGTRMSDYNRMWYGYVFKRSGVMLRFLNDLTLKPFNPLA